jgi:RNA 2',3'-cyclic 3'-phosphodiesterase
MPRLFAGLEVPSHVTSILSMLRGGLHGARWVEPCDYHITLRFIGDIGNRQAAEIDSLLAEVNRGPFPLRIAGLGSFGGNNPHSIYAAVEPNRALEALQNEVDRLVRACGVAPDKRRFQPHVTLARVRGATSLDVADYLACRGWFPSQPYVADRFVLYSARASTGGGPYIVEADYPLGVRAQAACG